MTKVKSEIRPLVLPAGTVSLLCSVSVRQLHRMVDRGEFPSPVILTTKRRGWLASDIDAWVATRQRAPNRGAV